MILNPPRQQDGLIEFTQQLVDIASPSYQERHIVDALEELFTGIDALHTTRVGDNLIIRTEHGHSRRLILAGHTDTVPAANNAQAESREGKMFGVGTTDMKSGLAVFISLMLAHTQAAVDLTLVLYAREEVQAPDSGLGELFDECPELLTGDLAILGEPTNSMIEAGCQGTLRVAVHLDGMRAHTARPWMGDNAIHRLGPLLSHISSWEPRKPVINNCEFHEALQVVHVAGGGAANVVPDAATLKVNHRFAPDRTGQQALEWVEQYLREHLRDSDEIIVEDLSNGAVPATQQEWVHYLIGTHNLSVSAKLGWTDVARFADAGVPAINFGPGDSTVAHTQDEYVEHDKILSAYAILDDLIRSVQ